MAVTEGYRDEKSQRQEERPVMAEWDARVWEASGAKAYGVAWARAYVAKVDAEDAAKAAGTLNEDGTTVTHAAFGDDGSPLCGWISDDESVTADWSVVDCRDCIAAR
jgi:hypothetical protein